MAAAAGVTEAFARYVCELGYDDLPVEVVVQAKRLILDSLGCQLGGTTLAPGRKIVEYALSLGDRSDASVVGTSVKVSCPNAALVNATLAHADELDESMDEIGHVAAVLVPSILAVGEKQRSSGRDLIVAMVAGYDLAGRLRQAGLATTPVWNRLSLYAGGLGGALIATVGAGKLLGLSVEQLRMALGLAGSQTSGQGSDRTEPEHMTKAFVKGAAAHDGVLSAQLARMDVRAPLSIFEGRHGFLSSYVGESARPDELVKGLGSEFPILDTCFKLYAAGHPIHAPVFGTLKLLSAHRLKADDIDDITVRLAEFERARVDGDPTLSVNLQYCLAVAVLDGRLMWEQFAPDRAGDARLNSLRHRIHAVHDPRLDEMQRRTGSKAAVVELRTRDGRRFEEEVPYPPGEPRNPATQAQLEEKFLWLATKVVPEDQAERILRVVGDLERADASTLADLVRARAARAD